MTTENVKINIKRLCVIDFDSTLMNTIMPLIGKSMWEKYYNKPFEFKGWWGRKESLDLNVFDIKPFDNVLNLLNKEVKNPESYVMILTSRQEKLRPQLQAVLDKNHIVVDRLDMKKYEKNKGEKILDYIKEFPKLKEIDVYDDRDLDIQSYKEIESKIPKTIKFRIHLAKEGELSIVNENRGISEKINEEIINLIKKIKGLYL